jgi:hypothetical protein
VWYDSSLVNTVSDALFCDVRMARVILPHTKALLILQTVDLQLQVALVESPDASDHKQP